MYYHKVKQGSPLDVSGQGLSGVGMILISSTLAVAYWTELLKSTSSKIVSFVNKMHLSISMLVHCVFTVVWLVYVRFDCNFMVQQS